MHEALMRPRSNITQTRHENKEYTASGSLVECGSARVIAMSDCMTDRRVVREDIASWDARKTLFAHGRRRVEKLAKSTAMQ